MKAEPKLGRGTTKGSGDEKEAAVTTHRVGSTTEPEETLSLIDTLRLLAGTSRGFWAVNLVNFGDGIAYFGVLNLLVLFLQNDIGMSTTQSHIAVSTFTGIVTVGMFLGGGFVSDWLGVRRALAASLLLGLLGRMALVAAPDFGSSVLGAAWVGLIVMAVGEAIIQPALYAGVKEYSDKRAATMGYALIYAVMNLGIVAEQMVSPLIREWSREAEGTVGNPAGGISGVFWALVGVTLLLLVAHLSIFTRKVEQTQRNVPDVDEVAGDSGQTIWQRFRSIPILDIRFLFFIFVLLPVRTLFAHQWLTIPDYVMRCFPTEIGERYEWISALNPMIIVIGVPLIAAWTRKASIVKMMIIGTSISALATGLLIPEPNVTLLLAYVVVFSIGEAAWSSRFLEYVAELAPAGRVGAYMGIATLPWFLAKSTTGWYSGAMLEFFVPKTGAQDPGTMWMIYGLIAMMSPIGLILGRRWVERGVKTTV